MTEELRRREHDLPSSPSSSESEGRPGMATGGTGAMGGPGAGYPTGGGMAEGARPAVAGQEVKKQDRKRRSPDQGLSIFFRFLQLCSSLIAFVVLLFTWDRGLGWTHYHAFRYVFAATAAAAGWAFLMLVLELLQLCIGRKIRSLFWRVLVCIVDWILAILTFSAGCAGAAVTTFNDTGVPLVNFAPCTGATPFVNFCTRTKVAVALSFITFGFLIPHLILSTLSLLVRLYEG